MITISAHQIITQQKHEMVYLRVLLAIDDNSVSLNYNLFGFLDPVDQNPWFSQKLLIIAAICNSRIIPCVISFKKMCTFMALSSVLYEVC